MSHHGFEEGEKVLVEATVVGSDENDVKVEFAWTGSAGELTVEGYVTEDTVHRDAGFWREPVKPCRKTYRIQDLLAACGIKAKNLAVVGGDLVEITPRED